MNKLLANRLKVELNELKEYPQFSVDIDKKKQMIWYVSFKGEEKTLYENENFKIKFEFPADYPMKKPAVTFVEHIPINPYVFSNGLICLNILDTEWTPLLRVSTISVSVVNLLSSTTEKKKPVNDEEVCKSGCKNFNQGHWTHNYKNI